MGLAARPDALDADWLTHELTEAGLLEGVRVTAVRSDDIGTGVGVFGAIARLHLDYDGPTDAPRSVIAKMPCESEANRGVGMALRLYEREGRFFSELAAETPLRIPRCFVNVMDVDAGEFLLVMEDFAGLEAGDQLSGVTPRRAAAVLDAVAPMHARWWANPELDSYDWVPRQDDPMFYAAIPGIVSAGVAALEPILPGLPPGSGELAARVEAQFSDIITRCAAGPRTLIHGDLRLDNLFWLPGGEPALIDWQLSLRNRGVYDLVWLVATSMDPDIQDEHLDGLIDHYRLALARHGVDYPDDELRLACAEQAAYLLSGPLSLIGTFDFSEAGDGRAAELTRRWVRRGFNAALRFGSLDVL